MRATVQKTSKYLSVVLILLAIAFCCRWVDLSGFFIDEANPSGFVLYSAITVTIRNAIHILLLIAWCVSIYIRILDRRIRNLLISVGGLVLLWLLVRVCKWEYVKSYEEPLVRYLWYGFYISIILLPLQGVFIAALAGQPEGYKTPGWLKWLYVPTIALILIVFTNDIHRMVFAFPGGLGAFDTNYRHEIFYEIILGWVAVLALCFLAVLLKKSRIPGSKKYQKLPFFILAGFVGIWLIHTLNLFPNDQTLLNCLLIVLLLESEIQTGLIRSNTNYDVLFAQSTIAAQILDNTGSARYISGAAMDVNMALFNQQHASTLQIGDTLFHRQPIAGGHVLWQDNISEINSMLKQLQETREQLGEAYELKRAEVSLRERKIHAEAKSRLYDHIAREISPQLDKANALLLQAQNATPPPAKICCFQRYALSAPISSV